MWLYATLSLEMRREAYLFLPSVLRVHCDRIAIGLDADNLTNTIVVHRNTQIPFQTHQSPKNAGSNDTLHHITLVYDGRHRHDALNAGVQ